MNISLTLILAGSYTSCIATKKIWQQATIHHQIDLEVVNLEEAKGEAMAVQLNLTSFPALLYNNKVIAVGHPEKHDADKIIANLDKNT